MDSEIRNSLHILLDSVLDRLESGEQSPLASFVEYYPCGDSKHPQEGFGIYLTHQKAPPGCILFRDPGSVNEPFRWTVAQDGK